jgi:SAM-dependent methyltransferase
MDYVLGTHDEEIARLALQHRVWRSRALAAWRQAGFTVGQTVVDVGCGPGFASLDLAELVGPTGRVVALDKSKRFLDVLEAMRRQRQFENLTTYELDLDSAELPTLAADGAWCRWVFAFVQQPRKLLVRLATRLRPGGTLAIHEYFDYATWRAVPPCQELEEFVETVMDSWRASGGEPDIGLSLPRWLEELGFEIKGLRPLLDIVGPSDWMWLWLRTFIEVGRRRLVDLGYLTPARAEAVWQAFAGLEATPGTLMITPAVLELVAVRR